MSEIKDSSGIVFVDNAIYPISLQDTNRSLSVAEKIITETALSLSLSYTHTHTNTNTHSVHIVNKITSKMI